MKSRPTGGFFYFGLIVLAALPLRAWGPVGHSEVNADAVDGLPSPLFEFFDAHRDEMADHASDPDVWKEKDQSEGTNHYIDIDELAPFPFAKFPKDYEAACREFGEDKVASAGVLPWRIAEYTGKLSADFKAKRWKKAVLTAAALGHYVGDLHQPLHTTKNHDGQLTGNDGVHLRFEDDMLSSYQEYFDVDVKVAEYVRDPVELSLEAIRSGYPGIDTILDADSAAEHAAGDNDELYYQKLYEGTWGLVNQRISAGASALASLIYTAWLDAGKPVPPEK